MMACAEKLPPEADGAASNKELSSGTDRMASFTKLYLEAYMATLTEKLPVEAVNAAFNKELPSEADKVTSFPEFFRALHGQRPLLSFTYRLMQWPPFLNSP